jgi:hypothetical protein
MRASHRRVPHRCVLHEYAPILLSVFHGRVSYGRASLWHTYHWHVSYGDADHERASRGRES